MEKYRAHISKITDLDSDLQKSLDFVNWKNQVEVGSTVFIKPNFTYPFYKEGITTSPALIKSLLEILKDRPGRVIVGESNGGNHSFTADQAFKGHNMHQICKEAGAELVNLSNIPSVWVSDKIQGKTVKVQLPKMLLEEVDCFISVPVLKVHVMTTATLSIKNLWGCYPDTMRCLHHKYLDHKLALINKVLHPKLSIIDGTYSLDGHGPMFGKAIRTNLLLSSNNPVVADALGVLLMGIPIAKVNHILIAEKECLGTTCLEDVHLNGTMPEPMGFAVSKTPLDVVSILLFHSETLAKIVMDSPFSPIVYGCARLFRTKSEKEVANHLGRCNENTSDTF
jgi:uncharacterized protein (DUF362 family)